MAPGLIGSRHPSITQFGVFKAQDTFLAIAAGNDRMFPKLCDALGVPEAQSDPKFATNRSEAKTMRRSKSGWNRYSLRELPLPNGKTLVAARCPVQFAGDLPRAFNPAPGLDQHRDALLKELDV